MPVAYLGGPHDDFLFMGQAASILDGHWLGPFGRLTLSKGPFFPIFLAACAILHVSPQLATEAVLLGADWLTADLVARLASPRLRRTLVFAILAANPAPLLVGVAACVLPLLAFAAIDAREYGVFRIDDMTQGPFARAYGAFARVGEAPRMRYFPIPRAARLLAYGASPAAATLAPYLEGQVVYGWMMPGCSENPIAGCDTDVRSDWFMWALRDPAVTAGITARRPRPTGSGARSRPRSTPLATRAPSPAPGGATRCSRH